MDAPVSQGRVLLGKYRVERVIGRGAMGVVLAARHMQLEDRVAIKLLLPEMMSEEGVVDRFLQEARAARRIKSEHVAQVTDVGLLESGTPYIIMEYLEGRDLAKLRGERGTLEVEEVVDYVLQASEAIAEGHANGIIHRDLKPANLFLTRRPDGAPLIKVLDFGTSKVSPRESSESLEMTRTGMAIGSPSYMAPEQMLSSRNIDQRVDVWALGIILYNLLTGTFPFRAETLLQMCAAVMQLPPVPPRQHRPDLPAKLEAVILKCLEKRPDQRFGDLAELARALFPFAPRHARLSVERIERVLGVTSDLAAFLAPSVRSLPPAENERIEVQIPAALLPPAFEARSSRNPEAALITKSFRSSSLEAQGIGAGSAASSTPLSSSLGSKSNESSSLGSKSIGSSSLASVVRSHDDCPTLSGAGMLPRPKRTHKAVAVGTVAFVALGAALLFTFRSPLASESGSTARPAPAQFVDAPPAPRALANASAIDVPSAIETATPQDPALPSTDSASATAAAPAAPAVPSMAAPGAAFPAQPQSFPPQAVAPGTPGVAGPSGIAGATAPQSPRPAPVIAQTVTGMPQAAVPSAPVKKYEPSVVIPDDR